MIELAATFLTKNRGQTAEDANMMNVLEGSLLFMYPEVEDIGFLTSGLGVQCVHSIASENKNEEVILEELESMIISKI